VLIEGPRIKTISSAAIASSPASGSVTRIDGQGNRDAREGLFAEGTKSHITRPTSDKSVCKNVRAALSRAVSHPYAIDCSVSRGHVYLRGDVYSHELQRALDEVRRVPGVLIITDHLTLREAAEGVRPNGSRKSGDGWSVAGRVFAGATSCALLVWGVRERKALGAFGASVGESLRHMSKADVEQKLDHVVDAIERGLDVHGTSRRPNWCVTSPRDTAP
jgi:hypothetical protein